MNFIYFGSSGFSQIVLEGLYRENFLPALVVSKPDRPKGRGLKLSATAVSIFAESKALALVKPQSLNEESFREEIGKSNPEFFIVVDYGKIIPEDLLSLPKKFALGLHPSLLPFYRGPAPIEYALLKGDLYTGLTIFKVNRQVDSGEIIFQKRVPIENQDDHLSLSLKLAEAGAIFLVEGLKKIEDNKYKLSRQDELKVSFTRKFTKQDGLIDWQRPAIDLRNQIRAMVGWPSAYTHYNGRMVKILKADISEAENQLKPGQIIEASRRGINVACGQGVLKIVSLQPEGKKAMDAGQYVCGYRLKPGESYG